MLEGKTILVTGGLGRVGQALAEAISMFGGTAVLTSRSQDKINDFNKSKNNNSIEGYCYKYDDDDTAISKLIDFCLDKFGNINGLVNNAYASGIESKLASVNLDDWNYAARNDLGLPLRLSMEIVKHVEKTKISSIVNVSSIYGVLAPDFSIYEKDAEREPVPIQYAATKAAIIQISRYMSVYWAKKSVRVNAVTLGGVFNNQDEDFLEAYGRMVPTGRMITREEAANSICFLLSSLSSGVNGENIMVDAGRSAW